MEWNGPSGTMLARAYDTLSQWRCVKRKDRFTYMTMETIALTKF